MSQTKAIVDKLLTEVSSGYVPEGYISDMILPTIRKKQSSGLLGGYSDSHLRITDDLMGGCGEAPRVEPITRTTQSYVIENHGLEGLVCKDDFDNVEKPFDALKDETIGLSTMVWLNREKAIADTLTSTGVITQNATLSGTDQFNDYTSSKPLEEFRDARGTIYDAVGMPPDTAILSWRVADTLAYHPNILETLGFSQNRAGQLSPLELAKAMGVKRVLIGQVQANTAKEGQTDVRTSLWGKDVVFAVTPKTAQKYQTSLGYTVRKAGEKPNQVFRYSVNNPPGSQALLVTNNYDDLLSNVSAAFLIKDAIA